MTINEPATFVTDCLLALVAGWLARRLQLRTSPAQSAARAWMWTLVFTAASALVGGAHHGFASDPPTAFARRWWVVTLWLIDLTSAAMAASWVHEIVRPSARRICFALIAVRLVGFAIVVAYVPLFKIATLDYGSSLALWLGAAVVLRPEWSRPMLAGVLLSVAAALVQGLRLAPAAWFNHNDLYHVIQALGLAAFYRAALRLGDNAVAK